MQFNSVLNSVNIYEAGKPIELVVREYGVAPEDIIKLASNENPFGCSKKVQQAVQNILPKMALYPDDSMYELKEALSKKYRVKSNNIIVGSGSDQIIEFAVHAKLNSSTTVLMNNITFAMYEIYAKHVGAHIVKTTSVEHDLAQFKALNAKHNPGLIFICTPNNPTGDAIDKEALYEFLDGVSSDTLVVVDGAYMEYTAYANKNKAIDVEDLINRYENVLYLGTFSKAYGLGGMRIGYGIAKPHIIEVLHKIRPPFNITTLSLQAAIAALQDEAFVLDSIKHNFEQMSRFYEFAQKHNLQTIESFTNFVTLILPEDKKSKDIAQILLQNGMIVRDLTGYGLNALRVTIGTHEQNSQFFARYERYCS